MVGQSLAETNYFEEATEVCHEALGINHEQAEQLFKQHVLLKPEQRDTYAKIIHSVSDQMSQDEKAKRSLSAEETRDALLFLTQVRASAIKTKDELLTAYKEKERAGKK